MFAHIHIDPNSALGRFILVFVCPPLFMIMLAYVCWERYQADQSLQWTRTTGVIVSAEQFEDALSFSWRTEPRIKYSYKVGKVDYDGDQIDFGGAGLWGSGAYTAEKLRMYPRGKKIDVYYDPEEPTRACLEQGKLSGENLAFLILFVVMLCGNLWFARQIVSAWLFNEPVPRV